MPSAGYHAGIDPIDAAILGGENCPENLKRVMAERDRLCAAATKFADFFAIRDVTVWLQTREEYAELTRLHQELREAISPSKGS